MVDKPSREWLKQAADAEDAAGGQISVGGMAADLDATDEEIDAIIAEMDSGSELGDVILKTIVDNMSAMPMESPLAVVDSFQLVDGGWRATMSGAIDREVVLDELVLSPKDFKPGTIVVVREPRE